MFNIIKYKNKLETKYNLKIFTDNVEYSCLEQTEHLLEQEVFKDCKIRLMPDCHTGIGAVVGFTADLGDKVIPNIVGSDIGCGMYCVNFGKIDIDLKLLDDGIHKEVPAGKRNFDYKCISFNKIKDLKCLKELKDSSIFDKQIGTLGGGNHFIELDKDEEDNKYLVIHTGSRNLGKQVAEFYQEQAIKIMSVYMKKTEENDYNNTQERNKSRIPDELCYLTGIYKDNYLHDMKICQEYAELNREKIAENIINKVINPTLKNKIIINKIENFHTIHNYINFQDNIVRKGAISAKKGEKVIIPMNMRDGSLICIGKGNEDWNFSAPHGAGRIMSRSKAKEDINIDEYINSMGGIYTTSVNLSTIDEAPQVYKPMQEIVQNINDTVEIVKVIKPIYNFKASS